MDDLPAELLEVDPGKTEVPDNWEKALAQFADYKLNKGDMNLLTELNPIFERILLQAALKKTGGRKIEAADLLGWGAIPSRASSRNWRLKTFKHCLIFG